MKALALTPLVLWVSTTPLLTAAIINSSTTCITSVGAVTTVSGCTLAGFGTQSSGWATALGFVESEILSGNTLTISASASAQVLSSYNSPGVPIYTAAAVTGSGIFQFATGGPPRQGYLSINGLATADAGVITFGLNTNPLTCIGGAGRACGYTNLLVPVNLGTGLTYSDSVDLSAFYGNNPDNSPISYANVKATLQFFEADGVTPVDLIVIPEPSVMGLLAVGLICLGGAKLRQSL